MEYRWWVFIHLVGVFGFLITHGVSVVVALQLRKERNRDRIRTLLQLSGASIRSFYASLAVLLIGGVVAGFQANWWSQRWIWWSLYLLAGITVLMLVLARPYYKRVKESLALRPSGAPRISDEELAARLASPVPIAIAVLGFGTLLAILWLMIFKPA